MMSPKDLIQAFNERYLNKIDIGYRLPPQIKLEEFWSELFALRRQQSVKLPLKDQRNHKFWYFVNNLLQKNLHEIDSYGRDTLYSLVKADIESELIKESLIEEAFYSSVIEGAFSTLKRARELAENKISPKDKSEQMILNNFYAMRFILENKDQPFSHGLILELHKIVAHQTLPNDEYAGKYRDDMVYITDGQGRTVYTPPKADAALVLLDALIDWINAENNDKFIHPIIKAAVLHFYFVYVHPFFDGNGRTARALFYFYSIKNDYAFFKYFSIASIINAKRGEYYKSIKNVEEYGSDLTYFLLYMTDSIFAAIAEIKTKISEHYRKDYILSKIKETAINLNLRQEKFLRKFLVWKDKTITISKYLDIFGVVYQTGRADLLDLSAKGILVKQKKGRNFVFVLNAEF